MNALIFLSILIVNTLAQPQLFVYQRGNSLQAKTVDNINGMVTDLSGAIQWNGVAASTNNEATLIANINSGSYDVLLALNPSNSNPVWSVTTETAVAAALQNQDINKLTVFDRYANGDTNVPDLDEKVMRRPTNTICPYNAAAFPSTGPVNSPIGCWTGNSGSHGSIGCIRLTQLQVAHPETQVYYHEADVPEAQAATHVSYCYYGAEIQYSGTPMDYYLAEFDFNQKALDYFTNSMALLVRGFGAKCSEKGDCGSCMKCCEGKRTCHQREAI